MAATVRRTAIFSALPRKGTFFTNRQFLECLCQVLGIPSPFYAAFENQYIGTKEPKLFDSFGIGIANATCTGDHWRHSHDKLKFGLRNALHTATILFSLNMVPYLEARFPLHIITPF